MSDSVVAFGNMPPWEKLIEIAMRSPSGDNCQPWFFESNGLNLKIKVSRDLSRHFLNKSGRADLLSLGCIIESLHLESLKYGWTFEYEIESELCLKLNFKKTSESSIQSIISLRERRTDRSIFNKASEAEERNLESLIKEFTKNCQNRFPKVKFSYKKVLSPSLRDKVTSIESLLWKNLDMITDFLAWVRFFKRDWKQKKDGFYRAEVGVKIFDVPTLLLAKKIPAVKKILSYVMPFMTKKKSEDWNKNVMVYSFFSTSDLDSKNLIELGRATFHWWSLACQQGFSLQPITMSTLTAGEIAENFYNSELPEKEVDFYRTYFKDLQDYLQITDPVIWGLRVGVSSAKNDITSLRRDIGSHYSKK